MVGMRPGGRAGHPPFPEGTYRHELMSGALQLSEQALHTRLLVIQRDVVGAAGFQSSGRSGLSADTPMDEGAGL